MVSAVEWGNREAILEAFERDGLVVVSGVLSEGEVELAVEELWSSPRLIARGPSRRDDPSSWVEGKWPQGDGGRNFLDSLNPFLDSTCWRLIQNERVVSLHRVLYGEEVMAMTAGRWGVMRPTEGHPEWRTEASWLHWDQNPWAEPGFVQVQSLVCLSDQNEMSGGFACVPGAHRNFERWGQEHPEGSVVVGGRVLTRQHGRGNPFTVPPEDPLQQEISHIYAPRGSVILWDGRIPHQNYPNTGAAFRVVHYLPFARYKEEPAMLRREHLRKKLVVLSLLSQAGGCADGGNSSGEGPRPADAAGEAFFPAQLTDVGRKVLCVPPVTPGEHDPCDGEEGADMRQAILWCLESAAEEACGNAEDAARKLRRASKKWPEIEQWFDAIFGV